MAETRYEEGVRTRAILLFVVLATLTGCPGPTFVVQQYAGPRREEYTLAILRVNGPEPVRLLALDGEDMRAPLVEDGRLHVERLPGKHVVAVFDLNEPHRRSAPVSFETEAGKVYRVAFVDGRAHVLEVDRASDKVVRDLASE